MVPKTELDELFDYLESFLGPAKCIGEAWRLRKDGEIKYWPDVRPDEGSPEG